MADNIEATLGCITIIVVGLVLGGALMWGWYRAGIQAAVYEREGIHMTQWEVFIGSRPAERTINVK